MIPYARRRVNQRIQEAGKRIREDTEAKRAAPLEWGELPTPGGPQRTVVGEADATIQRSQAVREGGVRDGV